MCVSGLIPDGAACDRPVSLLDVYPTLIDLGDPGDMPQELSGQSLRPLLQNPDAAAWSHPASTTYLKGNHTVRDERYRYIRYEDGTEEFYDHDNDSEEFRNLADKPGMETLKRRWAVWMPSEDAEPVGPNPGWRAWRLSN